MKYTLSPFDFKRLFAVNRGIFLIELSYGYQ
ncbi:hypothetical protein GGR08_000442 [Bartonella fuyuanensis]|uniref:Uncharacterized protein n=1 Tax=Bartonella fuyuanensis TaxID=1460968 RepID=A0A840DSW6_9HYPH|nr:hypothetical protein [Bartonella fuyuanensis]